MDILTRLRSLFIEMTEGEINTDAISLDTRLIEDLGFTSLNILWMAFAIEREFGVSLTSFNAGSFQTVGEVCEYIQKNQPN
ncbi:MAG: acyl carrier protein [Christensenellales bacterium]|jgi:acyl carrier protein